MHELQMTDVIEKKHVHPFIQAILAYGGMMVSPSDIEQLHYPIDQAYIDFQLDQHIITLHYEHYTGISLLSDTAHERELRNVYDGFSVFITDKKIQKLLLNPPLFLS